MTAYQFIRSFKYLPFDFNGNIPVEPSNSCLRRWMENGSIIINGIKVKPNDEIEFPVTDMVFFPKSRERKTTMR